MYNSGLLGMFQQYITFICCYRYKNMSSWGHLPTDSVCSLKGLGPSFVEYIFITCLLLSIQWSFVVFLIQYWYQSWVYQLTVNITATLISASLCCQVIWNHMQNLGSASQLHSFTTCQWLGLKNMSNTAGLHF